MIGGHMPVEGRLKSANEDLVYTQSQLDIAEEKLAKIKSVLTPPEPEEDQDGNY